MNNIVIDFRHNYVRGDRLEAQEIVYQYDEGRVIEAYVPEQAGFVLNVGYESDSTLYIVEVDSTTADDEGGYKVLATLPDTFLTRYGNLLIYVIASEDEMVVTTYEGVVPVRPKAVSEDYVTPTAEESSILARCAAAANASETAQGTAEAKALVAEGYAVGEQDGTAVESGTYYHNNAKYYAEQASSAEASATAAAASALVAEGYSVGKQNGTAVGDSSPYYHNNAEYFAGQAAASAAAFVVDDTLTQTGEAADAKATGDAIGAITSNLALHTLANVNYRASTADLEYVNTSFTVPAGALYLVFLFAGYSSAAPMEIALTTSTATPSAANCVYKGDTSGMQGRSPAILLTQGTFYMWVKRASVPTADNTHWVYGAILNPGT